jgi:excisionase family DNA binding protein
VIASASVRWLTPPEVAEQLGVDPSRVISWIRSGKLDAVNLSDGLRPRYKIDPDELARFLAARSTAPAPKPTRKRRTSSYRPKYFQ